MACPLMRVNYLGLKGQLIVGMGFIDITAWIRQLNIFFGLLLSLRKSVSVKLSLHSPDTSNFYFCWHNFVTLSLNVKLQCQLSTLDSALLLCTTKLELSGLFLRQIASLSSGNGLDSRSEGCALGGQFFFKKKNVFSSRCHGNQSRFLECEI